MIIKGFSFFLPETNCRRIDPANAEIKDPEITASLAVFAWTS